MPFNILINEILGLISLVSYYGLGQSITGVAAILTFLDHNNLISIWEMLTVVFPLMNSLK